MTTQEEEDEADALARSEVRASMARVEEVLATQDERRNELTGYITQIRVRDGGSGVVPADGGL